MKLLPVYVCASKMAEAQVTSVNGDAVSVFHISFQ